MSPQSIADLAEQLAASERRVAELGAKYLPPPKHPRRTASVPIESSRRQKQHPDSGQSMKQEASYRSFLWMIFWVMNHYLLFLRPALDSQKRFFLDERA